VEKTADDQSLAGTERQRSWGGIIGRCISNGRVGVCSTNGRVATGLGNACCGVSLL
jgi:hypothetical protein